MGLKVLSTCFYITSLILTKFPSTTPTSSSSSTPPPSSKHCPSPSQPDDNDDENLVLSDILSSLQQTNDNANENEEKDSAAAAISSAISDFSSSFDDKSRGESAWKFLRGLASSKAFRRTFWHKKPLLIRSDHTGGWVRGAFTLEKDLKLIHNSYISGHQTAEALRNGTQTTTWQFTPLKSNPARKTTWDDVSSSLQHGTIYFNTAGSLWPSVGALCRLTTHAFGGIPTNVNIYVTPPGIRLSVPPHTDRQDVIVMQTMGAKRWRVYGPPKRRRGVDPLNRGKAGDVLSFEELEDGPIIDAVLRPGDVMYVPTGFPHTTDTCTVTDMEQYDDATQVFNETSIHLTMGLDTHVWALTFAHLRWCLLQRSQKEFQLKIEDDDAYWEAMETIPIGFLGGGQWDRTVRGMKRGEGMEEGFKMHVRNELKRIMRVLEPHRWEEEEEKEEEEEEEKEKEKEETTTREAWPKEEEFDEVIEYVFGNHLQSLMELQEEMFSDIDPHSEETILKAYRCSQIQNSIMERFGAFSKNEEMEKSFKERRMEREERAKNV